MKLLKLKEVNSEDYFYLNLPEMNGEYIVFIESLDVKYPDETVLHGTQIKISGQYGDKIYTTSTPIDEVIKALEAE